MKIVDDKCLCTIVPSVVRDVTLSIVFSRRSDLNSRRREYEGCKKGVTPCQYDRHMEW